MEATDQQLLLESAVCYKVMADTTAKKEETGALETLYSKSDQMQVNSDTERNANKVMPTLTTAHGRGPWIT